MARMNSLENPDKGNVGRPAGSDSDKVRNDLLEAARQHFLSRDFKAVSVRQVARSAGVNGAMVNYYFGGKRGLYLAMVDELLQQLESKLRELGTRKEISVADFSYGYSSLLAANPWWPNFMVREVLFGEGEIREAVIEKFSSTMSPRLIGLVQQEIAGGCYRKDLNPTLTVVSLIAMTIFPFLARPLMEQVFNLKLDEPTVTDIATHNTRLFLQGVEAKTGVSTTERASTTERVSTAERVSI